MPRNGTTKERSYGQPHKRERIRLEPTVQAGQAYCAEIICLHEDEGADRWIEPGTPWDLAHDRTNGGYLGPAHARCNRAEGARWRHTHQTPDDLRTQRDWTL